MVDSTPEQMSYGASEEYLLTLMAHRLLLRATQTSTPAFREALDTFLSEAASVNVTTPAREGILLRTLAAFARAAGRPPAAVLQQYLEAKPQNGDDFKKFRLSIDGLLQTRHSQPGLVDQAMTIIAERLTDSRLRLEDVASALGVGCRRLSRLLSTHTGHHFRALLRGQRLQRAADLLATTTKSAKEIWAEVGYNDGTNFYHDFKRQFDVPPLVYRRRSGSAARAPGSEVRLKQHLPPKEGHRSGCLLIVDDDEGTRTTLGLYFLTCGYDAMPVASGREGLRAVANRRPIAIILDFHLPDIDGISWLRTFRRAVSLQACPVILLSADWSLEDRVEEISEHGGLLMSKLCTVEEIKQALERQLLSAERGLSP